MPCFLKGDGRAIIELEWDKVHPRTGKLVHATWRVAGDAELGLPGPVEERLYMVLLELTREQNWPQNVMFSRWDVMKRLGMRDTTQNYSALRDSFTRLANTRVRADRAFWDARSDDFYPHVIFGLLEEVRIAAEPKGLKSQDHLPLSSFKWSDTFFASLSAGNIRSLDLSFALSLDLPLLLRLFRYLDKHRFSGKGERAKPRQQFEIELQRLCEIHLGMAPSPYPSKLKERLQAAHEQLIERGFLAGVTYRKMRSKDREKVVYAFPPVTPATPVPAKPAKTVTGGFTSPLQVSDGQRATPFKPPTRHSPGNIALEVALSDPEWRHAALDAVLEALPAAEQDELRAKAREGLAPFLKTHPNTPGARGELQRQLRARVAELYPLRLREEIEKRLQNDRQ